jgi:hypothetical protein
LRARDPKFIFEPTTRGGHPAETLEGLREAEAWRRREVRLHFRMLERFREQQRRLRAERHFTL